MTGVYLWPRDSKWPFSGAFWGTKGRTSWAGYIGGGSDLRQDWTLARTIQRQLNTLSEYKGEKKGAVATFFSVLEKAKCAENETVPFRLLVTSWDDGGVAISGFGFQRIVGCNEHATTECWLEGTHPLLSEAKWPCRPMGAMVVQSAPDGLAGVCDKRDDSWRGLQYSEWLRLCGVRQ